ncbi:MAG: dual specificity protein phosphatase family protein [Vicinamibacteria bacterium]|nr:dual specificity protein phosphatase family protein [Vicinamibacteria bacterium]
MTSLLPTQLFPIDDDERLFISPLISDWSLVHDRGIEVIIDLEGDLDQGVSTRPGHLLYIYHHIYDEDLPDLARMRALAMLGAHLIRSGQKVLAHCGMGFNRSALLAGLILTELGVDGSAAVERLRERRPGALFNERFAEYLASVKGRSPYAG